MNNEQRAKKLGDMRHRTEEHWEWFEPTLHLIYIDAMIHGYKHRLDEERLEDAFDNGYHFRVEEEKGEVQVEEEKGEVQ